MFKYHDFEPLELSPGGFLKASVFENFDDCLREANKWITENQIEVTNIETVVLPNIHSSQEEGSTDGELRTSGDMSSYWYQVIRVWYR